MAFDTKKYKVYTWKNWMMLHWVINPGLAFNELVLGQRMPLVSLEDLSSTKMRAERMVIPCPHCQTMHDGRTWSTEQGTAFRNWFGLYCPSCGGLIPCLINITSLLFLIITAPIWYWFYKPLKRYWLSKQAARFNKSGKQYLSNPYDGKGWITQGLSFGLLMLLLNDLIVPYLSGKEVKAISVIIGIPIWAIGGLLFGYTLKVYLSKRGGAKH